MKGEGVGKEERKKEEIPAIKSRCAEFGTLICGTTIEGASPSHARQE
jgi:hypothetical protein